MEVTFTLDDSKVTKKLSGMIEGFSDYSDPFEKAAIGLLALYGVEVFEAQGRAIGEPWRQLAAATLQMRAERRGYYKSPPIATDKILIWTGRLQGGFKKEVRKDYLRIYNDVPYFKYHQKASGRPPQRRMLAINSRVISMVIEEVIKYATKTVNV